MVTNIDRRQLLDLIETGDVQIIDVLPPREYDFSHLPGAVNLPLKTLTEATVAHLANGYPTVVY